MNVMVREIYRKPLKSGNSRSSQDFLLVWMGNKCTCCWAGSIKGAFMEDSGEKTNAHTAMCERHMHSLLRCLLSFIVTRMILMIM